MYPHQCRFWAFWCFHAWDGLAQRLLSCGRGPPRPLLALLGTEDLASVVLLAALLARMPQPAAVAAVRGIALQSLLISLHLCRAASLACILCGREAGNVPIVALPVASMGVLLARVAFLGSLGDLETALVSFSLASCMLAMLCSHALSREPAPKAELAGAECLRRWTLRSLAERPPSAEDACVICLGALGGDEALVELTCHHVHHKACIEQWFLKGGRGCPLRCPDPDV